MKRPNATLQPETHLDQGSSETASARLGSGSLGLVDIPNPLSHPQGQRLSAKNPKPVILTRVLGTGETWHRAHFLYP